MKLITENNMEEIFKKSGLIGKNIKTVKNSFIYNGISGSGLCEVIGYEIKKDTIYSVTILFKETELNIHPMYLKEMQNKNFKKNNDVSYFKAINLFKKLYSPSRKETMADIKVKVESFYGVEIPSIEILKKIN